MEGKKNDRKQYLEKIKSEKRQEYITTFLSIDANDMVNEKTAELSLDAVRNKEKKVTKGELISFLIIEGLKNLDVEKFKKYLTEQNK